MVREMDKTATEKDRIAEEIEKHVQAISARACMFEAMDQETAAMVEIPSFALGEAGRSIQRSILRIRELVDDLQRAGFRVPHAD